MMGAQGPGRMLGAYQLGPALGAGPVGDVFRARTGTDARELAVKVLRPPLANSPQVRQKFAAIAAIVATLDHPHVLPLDYFGEQGGQTFGVTPLVAQGSLMTRLNNGRLSPKDAAPLFSQVCDALNYLSGQGMVHGNLKPTNILLFEGRHCMLGDFGQLWQVSEVDLTQTGISAEATFYMAPEQMEGFVDARSDIYSLGAILFHALTGQPPFPGQTPFEVLSRHNRQPVPSLRTLNTPVAEGALAFDEVLRIALAKNPAERFQSPLAMARAIVEAGNLANDLPSRAMPVIRPGQMPPGVMSPVPSRPNPAYGPMPGQMMPPRPNMPYGPPNGPPMLPPAMGPVGVPLFPGQVPPPGMGPPSRPRVPSQPMPPQGYPPVGTPGQDQSLQWLIPGSQPAGPPPMRGTPQPPNLDAANFLTARHSADMVDRILAGEDAGNVAPPTIETGAAARPRQDDWWDGDDDRRDYTDRSAIYDERDVRDWDDSRSVSVPSMRTPSRPASRDRWAESDDRYRRDDTGYSREMESERMPARGRSYDATGRNAVPDAPVERTRRGAADRGQPSVVIHAAKKRRSRLPAILGSIIFVVLLANVVLLSVAAPQYCPAHLCDGLHSRLAPLFGIKTTSSAHLTAALTKPDTTFTVAVAGTKTVKQAITLTSGGNSTWSATVDQTWVTVAPTSGSITAAAPITLDVTMTPDVTVTAGPYTATVTFTSGGQTVTIKLPITVGS